MRSRCLEGASAAAIVALMACGRADRHPPGASSTAAPRAPPAPFVVSPPGALPGDFPVAIPLYPGARVLTASRSRSLGKPEWAVTLETPDAYDPVRAFYDARFATYQVYDRMEMGKNDMITWVGPAYEVTVMISASAEGTTVVNLSTAER